MRICFLLFVCTYSAIASGQKQYRCVYRDSTSFVVTDSALTSMKDTMRSNLAEKGIPEESLDYIVDEVMNKLKEQEIYNTVERKVHVSGNTAIVRLHKIKSKGNLKMDDEPDSLMVLNDELYMPEPSVNGFSKEPISSPKKNFQLTGKTRVILNYSCKEYLSTDSTYRIWVTGDLPSSINPGIRTGNINGAVLAFEMTKMSFYTKCEIILLDEPSLRGF